MAIDPIINRKDGKDSTVTANSSIYTYVFDETTGRTYVGGAFNTLTSSYAAFASDGAVSRAYVGAFDASGKVSSWNPIIDGSVNTMTLVGNVLYIGGNFTVVNGVSRQYFAAINKTTGAVLSTYPTGNAITSVEYIYIDTTNNIAHINDTTYGHIALNITTNSVAYYAPIYFSVGESSGDYTYSKMVLNGSYIYATVAGGGFIGPTTFVPDNSNVNGNIVAFNATTGQRLSSFNPTIVDNSSNLSGPYSLDIIGNTVYIAGAFTTVNGVSRISAAALDKTSGALLSWYPQVPYGTSYFYQNISDGTNIYLSGAFTTINGISMYGFAGVDTSGNLISSNKLDYALDTSGDYHLQQNSMKLVSNGIMRMPSSNKKVWDTRYKVARN